VLAEEQGHRVLFTPPYHSDIQPIELLWARIKGEVGRQYSNSSTLAQVYIRLVASFDKVMREGHEGVDGMIRKAAKIAEEFYKVAQLDIPADLEELEDVYEQEEAEEDIYGRDDVEDGEEEEDGDDMTEIEDETVV
jgi:hypothetical protein